MSDGNLILDTTPNQNTLMVYLTLNRFTNGRDAVFNGLFVDGEYSFHYLKNDVLEQVGGNSNPQNDVHHDLTPLQLLNGIEVGSGDDDSDDVETLYF